MNVYTRRGSMFNATLWHCHVKLSNNVKPLLQMGEADIYRPRSKWPLMSLDSESQETFGLGRTRTRGIDELPLVIMSRLGLGCLFRFPWLNVVRGIRPPSENRLQLYEGIPNMVRRTSWSTNKGKGCSTARKKHRKSTKNFWSTICLDLPYWREYGSSVPVFCGVLHRTEPYGHHREYVESVLSPYWNFCAFSVL